MKTQIFFIDVTSRKNVFCNKIYIVFVAFNLVLRLIYLNNDDTNDSIKKFSTDI